MRSYRWLASMAMVLGLICLTSAAPAPQKPASSAEPVSEGFKELSPGGDFESVPVNDKGQLPAGWGSRDPKGVTPQIVAEARPGSAGKQCVLIPTTDQNKLGGLLGPMFPVDPQNIIVVSGWFKTEGDVKGTLGLYYGVNWFDADKKPLPLNANGLNYTYITGGFKDSKWTHVQTIYYPCSDGQQIPYKQYQAPIGAAYASLMFFSNGYTKSIWADDLSVTQEVNPADQIAGSASPDWIIGWEGSSMQRPYAREMAKYLSRVKGVNINYGPWADSTAKNAIVVTDAASAPPELAARLKDAHRDAFLIAYPVKFKGRDVCLLVSKETKSGDFAVYYFLNQYAGVDWVGPGALGEVAPSQPDWKLPEKIDDLQNPSYEHRYWKSIDMNTRRWGAGSFRMQFHHNLWNVFDPLKYKDQPDLYPFYEGKRNVPDGNNPKERSSGWQPCTGNPKSVDIATSYGLNYLKTNPDQISFSLTVNDGGVNFCLCPLCRAQDAKNVFDTGYINMTDRFFRFYTEVLSRVLAKNPDAYLAVQSYGRTKAPPAEVRGLSPRLQVFTVPDNTNPMPDVSERQKLWKAAGASPCVYQWLWDGGFLTVRNCPHAIADIVKLSNDLGGLGYYCEADDTTMWAAAGPKLYVLSHVLWNTHADVDVLLDRYMKAAFGQAAAPAMRGYFDQWEKIWERAGKETRYNTGRGWQDISQFTELTRDDLVAMDADLAKAQAAEASPLEKTRIGLVAKYYKWLRVNADQYLVTKELSDPTWVAGQSPEKVVADADRGLNLSPEFDALWKSTIAPDKTGWLLNSFYQAAPDAEWKGMVNIVRRQVVVAYEPAVDLGFNVVTSELLKKGSKASAAVFWKGQAGKHPSVARWINTQIYLLEHGPGPNLAVNGDFEQGTAGERPSIIGWSMNGSWEGLKTDFSWTPNSGRTGGHALAIGWGYNGSINTGVATKQGHRYRASIWYKTSTGGWHLKGKAGGSDFKFDAPVGEWRQVFTTFTAGAASTNITLEANGQDRNAWTWYDDLEVVEIGG